MIELNIKFHEKYKRLDALCKDIFSSKDGVTQYIYEMECTEPKYIRQIYNWEDIYYKLKHLRWVRNQLAHEVGAFESKLCAEDDVEWLDNFYNAVLHYSDPLAKVGKMKQQETQKYHTVNKDTFNARQTSNSSISNNTKPSLWSKIKAKIKKWFS